MRHSVQPEGNTDQAQVQSTKLLDSLVPEYEQVTRMTFISVEVCRVGRPTDRDSAVLPGVSDDGRVFLWRGHVAVDFMMGAFGITLSMHSKWLKNARYMGCVGAAIPPARVAVSTESAVIARPPISSHWMSSSLSKIP